MTAAHNCPTKFASADYYIGWTMLKFFAPRPPGGNREYRRHPRPSSRDFFFQPHRQRLTIPSKVSCAARRTRITYGRFAFQHRTGALNQRFWTDTRERGRAWQAIAAPVPGRARLGQTVRLNGAITKSSASFTTIKECSLAPRGYFAIISSAISKSSIPKPKN